MNTLSINKVFEIGERLMSNRYVDERLNAMTIFLECKNGTIHSSASLDDFSEEKAKCLTVEELDLELSSSQIERVITKKAFLNLIHSLFNSVVNKKTPISIEITKHKNNQISVTLETDRQRMEMRETQCRTELFKRITTILNI